MCTRHRCNNIFTWLQEMVKKEVEENQAKDKQEEEVDDDSGEEELEYDEEEQEEVEIKASSVKLFMMCEKIMLLSFHKILLLVG